MGRSVSVVIPVHNAAAFVREALQSARRQDHVHEIIVVDDGSDDSSGAVASREPGIRVLRQQRAGPGAARNAGARCARAEFIAFLDADDVWLPGKLARQLALLEVTPEPSLCFCACEVFADTSYPPPGNARRDALFRTHRAPLLSALVLERILFWGVGPFREDLPTAEDVEWFRRARGSAANALFVDEVLLRKRFHSGNTSLTTPGNTARLLRLLGARRAGY